MSVQFDEEKQNQQVDDLRAREEDDLARILANRYGLNYIDLSSFPIDTNALRTIPEKRARESEVAAFNLLNKKISLAVRTPNRQDVQNEIKDLERRGYLVELYITPTDSLESAWKLYKDISFATETKAGSLDVSNEEIKNFISKVQSLEDAKSLIHEVMDMKKSFRISRIVEIVVSAAIATKASDIHLEPEEDIVHIRFRIDGVLADITTLDNETYKLFLSRVKLLSGLKLNIKDTSQDGRFSIKIGKSEMEIRTSVLPGNYGESIVLRLLDPNSLTIPLESLGIPDYLLKIFREEITKPNGMILNTGPTGSGKTTTLYSFLNRKKSPGIKIITIEDPVEYHLSGIVQTQVERKKGYDFETGLRSSLRQDPDVIMVGEIRDRETAETAVHAALTGHLVFSTLHTNSAAGAFPRLIDLGLNPEILTSAISLIIAQRLVRKLCPVCKKEIELAGSDLETIKRIYDSIPEDKKNEFSGKTYEAVGCPECNGTGYKGRIGIFEAVITNKAIEEVIHMTPSERDIKKTALEQGWLDMSQDGVLKILSGITDIEEVKRVVDLETGEGRMDISR